MPDDHAAGRRTTKDIARAIIDEFLPSITWSQRKIRMAQRIVTAIESAETEATRAERERHAKGLAEIMAKMSPACLAEFRRIDLEIAALRAAVPTGEEGVTR